MITNEEARKAIEKYQKEHPLQFGTMIDVTTISSKESANIISQTIEQVSKKIDEDTELWCICEMAKMYMQGVSPVYTVRPKGEWIERTERITLDTYYECSNCKEPWTTIDGTPWQNMMNFCPNCGAEMRKGGDGE